MSSFSKFDVCSAALLAFGARRILSFDDGTAESIVAGGLYDLVVEEELARHRWNFAKKYFALNQLVGSPAHKWAYQWQLPSDCVLLRGIYANGENIAYEQYEGRTVGTNVASPIAEFTGRISEDRWPAYFMSLIKMRLEAHFVGALLKDPGTKRSMLDALDATGGFYNKSRALDAQEEPPHEVPKGLISRSRLRR